MEANCKLDNKPIFLGYSSVSEPITYQAKRVKRINRENKRDFVEAGISQTSRRFKKLFFS